MTPKKIIGAPKKDAAIKSAGIGHAYPSSPRAKHYGKEREGCWYCYFYMENGQEEYAGPFRAGVDAFVWLRAEYPNAASDKWCMSHKHPVLIAAIQKMVSK